MSSSQRGLGRQVSAPIGLDSRDLPGSSMRWSCGSGVTLEVNKQAGSRPGGNAMAEENTHKADE